MRRITSAATAFVVAGLALSCGQDAVRPPQGGGPGLSVKGRIAAVASRRSALAPASRSYSTAAVQKVLVYRDFGAADVSPVDANGNFAVTVERKAVGLVFLDAANAVVGYLSLAGGIEALPLMMVDSAVAQIDLRDITIQDGVGTPQHDPLGAGGEAQMTAGELAAYRLQSALFATIIRNLDMDGDGVIDVLTARPYWLMFGADFDGGVAATSSSAAAGLVPALNVFHFNFSDYNVEAGAPSGELVTPDGGRFAQHQTGLFTFMRNGQPQVTATMYHWVLQNTSWGSFASGTYQITYDAGRHVSFDVASPLNADNYIVAAHFWYEMTGTRITKVHWKWEMLNGASIDATRLMQEGVGLQFSYSISSQVNYHVALSDTAYVVDVDTAGLQSVLLGCNDLFGNVQMTNYRLRAGGAAAR
jgi:hypothetical protein